MFWGDLLAWEIKERISEKDGRDANGNPMEVEQVLNEEYLEELSLSKYTGRKVLSAISSLNGSVEEWLYLKRDQMFHSYTPFCDTERINCRHLAKLMC